MSSAGHKILAVPWFLFLHLFLQLSPELQLERCLWNDVQQFGLLHEMPLASDLMGSNRAPCDQAGHDALNSIQNGWREQNVFTIKWMGFMEMFPSSNSGEMSVSSQFIPWPIHLMSPRSTNQTGNSHLLLNWYTPMINSGHRESGSKSLSWINPQYFKSNFGWNPPLSNLVSSKSHEIWWNHLKPS